MNTDNLVVAVSYAHDSDEFNKKVVAFVSCLREKHGYDAIMDEYLKQKETAVDFNEMMAKILIYSIANYDAMKRLKDVLAEAIYDTFNIPVHYTTLSENEYEEMYALRQEKQCVLFEYYHK